MDFSALLVCGCPLSLQLANVCFLSDALKSGSRLKTLLFQPCGAFSNFIMYIEIHEDDAGNIQNNLKG